MKVEGKKTFETRKTNFGIKRSICVVFKTFVSSLLRFQVKQTRPMRKPNCWSFFTGFPLETATSRMGNLEGTSNGKKIRKFVWESVNPYQFDTGNAFLLRILRNIHPAKRGIRLEDRSCRIPEDPCWLEPLVPFPHRWQAFVGRWNRIHWIDRNSQSSCDTRKLDSAWLHCCAAGEVWVEPVGFDRQSDKGENRVEIVSRSFRQLTISSWPLISEYHE